MRGDVHRLPPPRGARGREPEGARYAVVVRDDAFEALSTVIVAPTSASARPASFRPEVAVRARPTRVLVEQLRAVDAERLGPRADRLTQEEMEDVDRALRVVLAL